MRGGVKYLELQLVTVSWERCVHQTPPHARLETTGSRTSRALKATITRVPFSKTTPPSVELAGGGVLMNCEPPCVTAVYLLVMRAAPGQTARRSWSVAGHLRGQT